MALTKRKTEQKYKFDINVQIIDLMIAYCLSSNENITMKGIINMKSFIDKIDFDQYSQNYEVKLRLDLIRYILDAMIDKSIREYELIKGYAESNIGSELDKNNMYIILDNIAEYGEISNADVDYINAYITERLNYSYMFKYQQDMRDCLDEIETGSKSMNSLNRSFNALVESMYKDLRIVKSMSEGSGSTDFSFRDETSFTSQLDKTIKELNKPANFMKTGIQELNKLTGGGWQNGRVYVLLGLPKKFKSGTLLNAAIWGAKYNKSVTTKDPTKKPCVVYISMENSTRETLERVYHYSTGGQIKNTIRELASKEILEELSVEGSEVDLLIWYRPNRSISTLDLDTMLDDLANDGKECVMLVQDYIARIKPSELTGDTRIDYGTVVNDFTITAKSRDIPVITAAQLNRNALKIVEQGIDSNASDLGKKIGSAEVGESQLIINNCDMAIVVNKEYSVSLNKYYLTFKCVASRYRDPDKIYFAHPFEEGNGMRLIEDYKLSKSYSLESVGNDLSGFNPNNISDTVDSSGGNPRFKNSATSTASKFFKKTDIGSDEDFNI